MCLTNLARQVERSLNPLDISHTSMWGKSPKNAVVKGRQNLESISTNPSVYQT